MSRQTLIKIGLLFLVSLLISITVQRVFKVSLEDIQNLVTSTGIWAPLVYLLVLFLGLSVPFNPISDSITVSIAALVFPSWVAILMTFVSHCLALTANYLIARAWGDDLLRKLLSKEEVKQIEKLGPKIHPGLIFGLRFILPLNGIGFDFISYSSGIAHVRFRSFFIASIVPWTILSFVFFFSAGYLRNISPSLIFLPMVFLIFIPILYFATRKKTGLWERLKNLRKN
jgi:uncharacterized membrane protein YdjX (TVP38/TMEM64 family)